MSIKFQNWLSFPRVSASPLLSSALPYRFFVVSNFFKFFRTDFTQISRYPKRLSSQHFMHEKIDWIKSLIFPPSGSRINRKSNENDPLKEILLKLHMSFNQSLDSRLLVSFFVRLIIYLSANSIAAIILFVT